MSDRIESGLGGRTAVVFGGAGFVGSHLCESLIRAGATVVAVDNLVTGAWSNLDHIGSDRLFTVEQDICEPLTISSPVDFVLNLASPASPPRYLELPLETLRAGSRGTEEALKLAHQKGARFLLASTSEVYGEPEIHPQSEDYWGRVNPIGPRSVYDEAKRYAEAVTMAYRRHVGVDTVIARLFNTYGPRMSLDDGRAVPAFMRASLLGEPIPIHGDGSQTRSLGYVSDIVEGLLLLLLSEEAGPVNLGNPEEVTMLELATEIAERAGVEPVFDFQPRPEDDPSRRRPDITRAKRTIGWVPTVELSRGLKLTLAWFAETLEAPAVSGVTGSSLDGAA